MLQVLYMIHLATVIPAPPSAGCRRNIGIDLCTWGIPASNRGQAGGFYRGPVRRWHNRDNSERGGRQTCSHSISHGVLTGRYSLDNRIGRPFQVGAELIT